MEKLANKFQNATSYSYSPGYTFPGNLPIELFRKNTGKKISTLAEAEYQLLSKVVGTSLEPHLLTIKGVRNKLVANGQRVAA